jgi:putative ABC transport system permease protein
MERLFQDLRYAWRLLWKQPGFTAVAAASLALGIGANTTIFSLVDALLLRPLPVTAPATLVSIFTTDRKNPGFAPSSHLNWKDLREQCGSFSQVLGYDFVGMSVAFGGSSGGKPSVLGGQMVSGNYFDVLGVPAAVGRTFTAEDDREGAGQPVAVLSDHLWRERLGGDRAAIGRTISIDNHPFTVIGVAPREFTGTDIGLRPELWVPMAMNRMLRPDPASNWYGTRRGLFLFAIGRLKPGARLAQAQAEATTLSRRLEHDFPNEDKGRSFKLVPLTQAAINPGFRQGVVAASALLLTVVGLVLLIACANVANLLLARASVRRKEIAVRLSLGAARSRLVRQLLTESLLLALLGGACGLLLAAWADRALVSVLPSLRLPVSIALELKVDPRVLAFNLILSFATGLLFGLVPALQASRPELVSALKSQAAPAGTGGRRLAGRNLLVAAQVALSLVALIAAGLFLRSLGEQQRADPGFSADRLVRLQFDLGLRGYDEARGEGFVRELAELAAAVPGVAAATVAQAGPFQGSIARSVFLDGQERTDNNGILIQINAVGPRYFETIGVPIVRGRAFTAADRTGAPAVAVVNEFMADKFWPNQSPLGQRFRFYGDTASTEVVGVAKQVKYNSIGEDPQPYIYLPLEQRYAGSLTLVARAAIEPGPVLLAVERQVRALDKDLPLTGVATLRQVLHDGLFAPRMGALLLGIFGALALVLATVGIYGVMSFSVAQRAREIGVRMSLGALPRSVLALVLYQGMTIVALGLGLGLATAFAVSRLTANLLFGISPTDPLAFVATTLLLAAVALAATVIPAQRATAVDPVVVLRQE